MKLPPEFLSAVRAVIRDKKERYHSGNRYKVRREAVSTLRRKLSLNNRYVQLSTLASDIESQIAKLNREHDKIAAEVRERFGFYLGGDIADDAVFIKAGGILPEEIQQPPSESSVIARLAVADQAGVNAICKELGINWDFNPASACVQPTGAPRGCIPKPKRSRR